MCDCISQAEQKFKELFEERMKERNINVQEIKESGFTTLPFAVMNGPIAFFHPYEIKYVALKQDGTPEKRVSTFKHNLIATFCPVCGEKYEKE